MSVLPPPPLRWWGWGEKQLDLPPRLAVLLSDELGVQGDKHANRRPALADVRIPPATMSSALRHALHDIVGGFHVRDDKDARIRHAAGRSYLDLIRLRSGVVLEAPDAVVHPASASEVLAVLRLCAEHSCAVVPFGGGTSVVGGVAPLHQHFGSLIVLDVDRIDSIREVDRDSLVVRLDAGMRGPRIESELNARGLTLGHFPQSFEYATVGGFAATRSAGQASGGYGRFDVMTRGLRLQSPSGEVTVDALPPDGTGPSVLQALLGSEGAFGVITDVTVRVQPLPALRHYSAWSFPDFASGVDALRGLAQSRQTPDVARLSDREETRVSLAMAGSRAARLGVSYLRARGHDHPCLVILGWEGESAIVGRRVRGAMSHLRGAGAVAIGSGPAHAWLRDRFSGPYLRDVLLDSGVMVETLETVTAWSRLEHLREEVVGALRETLSAMGTPPLVGCHVSHVYPDGASLYFTVLARQREGAEAEQWIEAKQSATDTILRSGGALSHHHGVGADHVTWMNRAHGVRGVSLVRALKHELDPSGVMNPGKLIS